MPGNSKYLGLDLSTQSLSAVVSNEKLEVIWKESIK